MPKCGACGKANSDEAVFCHFCGTRVATSAAPPVNEDKKSAELAALLRRLASDRRAESDAAPPPSSPPGPQPPAAAAPSAPRPATPIATRVVSPGAGSPYPMPPMAPAAATAPGGLRLVVMNRDGTDGRAYALFGGQFDIGRTEGDVVFEDALLGERHARVTWDPTGIVLCPLENLNGIYRRIRAPTEIAFGDRILVGKQLLQLEPAQEAKPAVESGVALFGSAVRPAWGLLRQLAPTGVGRDLFHMTRGEVVLGREQGDIVFSDDEYMSRRHARLAIREGRISVEDLASSNGTYLRLRGPATLVPGEIVRIGDQLLRFELA